VLVDPSADASLGRDGLGAALKSDQWPGQSPVNGHWHVTIFWADPGLGFNLRQAFRIVRRNPTAARPLFVKRAIELASWTNRLVI
jgi:hypothetical protein